MNGIPRLQGYPVDQAVVRGIRARRRGREIQRLARRRQERATGARRLLRLLSR